MTTISDILSTPATYGNVIDGATVASESGRVLRRSSPATGWDVAMFPDGTAVDIELAVAAARRVFDAGAWSHAPGIDRMRKLAALVALMRKNAQELAKIDAREAGTPLRVALDDVEVATALMEYAAESAAEQRHDAHTNSDGAFTGLVVREPRGVVGVIAPWSLPLPALCRKAAFALAAGCTVVAKPSEFTPGSAVRLAQLALEADVPAGVFNVVTGGSAAEQALSTHRLVDMITVTGAAAGRRALTARRANATKTSLWSVGRATQTVFADAALDDAVEGVVFGATHAGGERRVAGAHVLVQSDIVDEFSRRLASRVKTLRVGGPDTGADYGAMISARRTGTVLGALRSATSGGARLLTGGNQVTGYGYDQGFFLAPTVIGDVSSSTAVFQQELLAPVFTVTPFETVDEAAALANSVAYGFANAVWTRDLHTALNVAHRLRSGTVYVNATIDAVCRMPFGGFAVPGHEPETGRSGLEDFARLTTAQVYTGRSESVPFFA